MKLYTEEQVRKMLIQDDIFDIDDILYSQKPIELPTDEEIDGDLIFHHVKRYESTIGEIMALKIGAKWMRDKILNK